jgi:hypothetical protein
MNTTTKFLVIISTLIAAPPATAKHTTTSVKGSSYLSLMENAHMAIRLSGQKGRVAHNADAPQQDSWGRTINLD